jgi:molecular chaperone DnaJ
MTRGVVDLYGVLGVRRTATEAELRRAYRRLSRLLHPAVNPSDPVAAERFQAVAVAFEVLSDPERRARYDHGEPLDVKQPSVPEVGFEGFDFSGEVKRARAEFREIFDGILPGSEPAEPVPGEDLEQTATISFAESFRGTRRRAQLVRQDVCPICGGSGETSMAPLPCPRCAGTGTLRASRGHMVFTRSCPDCGGRGTQPRPCGRCEGEGRLMQSEWLEVAIPAGVASGSRVRVPGCGNAGRRGGKAGDFVLVVEVEPHPFFRREQEDLFCEVPVSMVEAATGAHIQVPTPDEPVTIEIPAGTQNGQRFRLRKRGMPRLGEKGRGDLYVEVRVAIPAVTDGRARELLQELARLEPQEPRRELLARVAPVAGE